MVFSKADSKNQISMRRGNDDRACTKRQIEILTPDGKKVQLNIQENTEIQKVKNDCELLCGIPSDIHVLQLEGRDVDDDSTLYDLKISEGCPLKLTVPQWWQKFISSCYKGDTKQVRKRIHVKMSEITREERGFTAAFIAAVQGNHSLMFAAFAGQKINLLSKTKLSGRNLLHAAVSGGNTSCVANILMNGGNALLEAPDEEGETPVDLAERLYGGKDGDMVNFLNIYLELHRRETNNYGDSKLYWDNLEYNNNNSDENSTKSESKGDDGCISPPVENVISNVANQNISQAGLNLVVTETLGNKSFQNVPTVSKINIEDYDAKTCNDALVSTSKNFLEAAEGKRNSENLMNMIYCKQGNTHTSDTGYYSSGGHYVEKCCTETNWNDNLFTQKNAVSSESEMTREVFDSSEQTVLHQGDSAKNVPTTTAEQSVARDCASSQLVSPRRAQLRFIEQKRKLSTTERPNLEQLMITRSDNHGNEEHENEQVPEKGQNADETREEVAKADVTHDCRPRGQVPTIASNINDSSENCPSPKPLRRAQLRKKSIVEQRRRKSLVQRPNLEEVETAMQGVEDGENLTEKTSVGTVQDNTDIDITESIDKLSVEAGQREGSDSLTTTTSQRMLQQKIDGDIFKNMTTNSASKTSAIGDNGPEKNEAEVSRQPRTEGYKRSESLGDESPVSAKNVLRLWQDQSHEADLVAPSTGDEWDAESRSPKRLRRALARKQAYMEQRRKKSATERPDVLKLIRRNKEWENGDANSDRPESESKRDVESLVAQNDVWVTNEEQENAVPYDPHFPPGNDVSRAQDETVKPGLTQSTQNELNKERTPIRRAQRCSNTGLLATNQTEDTGPRSWSSVSGRESDESDQERAAIAKPIAPIAHRSKAKTSRRRRLPKLPDKAIKLPVIKIEDSGISRELTTMTALQLPLGRSRSGSTCSEDSTSSAEMSSARAR